MLIVHEICCLSTPDSLYEMRRNKGNQRDETNVVVYHMRGNYDFSDVLDQYLVAPVSMVQSTYMWALDYNPVLFQAESFLFPVYICTFVRLPTEALVWEESEEHRSRYNSWLPSLVAVTEMQAASQTQLFRY